MINALEGIPGSGKSYEAVAFHVLANLAKGRLVVTNLPLLVDMFAAINPDYRQLIELRVRPLPVRGTWDAERVIVDEHGNMSGEAFELFEDGHTEPAPLGAKPFGHVWDFYHPWKDKHGRGPVFIIDECHNALPRTGTPDFVVQWFKLHRHFNVDVLLMTQKFRGMNQDIADLIAMLVKCRKADILGRADHYIRKVHSGYRGAVISTEERKYKPEYFVLYKSHTQGNSVAESAAQDVSPFIVKFNRFKWGVFALAAVATIWAFWPEPDKPKTAAKRPAVASLAQASGAGQGITRAVSDPVNTVTSMVGKQASDQPTGVNEFPEPYGLKGLHVVGQITMKGRTVYVLAVSQNGMQITTVTSSELQEIGYKWKALTDCAASLQWKEKVRALTCDSPQITIALQRTAPAVNSNPVH